MSANLEVNLSGMSLSSDEPVVDELLQDLNTQTSLLQLESELSTFIGTPVQQNPTNSNPLPAPTLRKPRIRRSKNGCLSCRRMKIKCGEQKPSCEYCEHTGRECVYSQQSISKTRSKKPNFDHIQELHNSSGFVLQNKTLQKLNSMTLQLNVSSFELRLLNAYKSVAPEFAAFKLHQDAVDFWTVDIPHIWSSSALIKKALYTLTSVGMLSKYDLSSIENICLSNEDSENGNQDLVPPAKINIFNEANKYYKETSDLIDKFVSILPKCTPQETAEIVGQIVVAESALLASITIFPSLSNGSKDLKKCGVFTVFEIVRRFTDFGKKYIFYLFNTRYEKMLSMRKQQVEITKPNEFPFVNHLRDYVTKHVDPLDTLQITFLHAIARIETDSYRALVFDYPIPLSAPLAELSADEDYMNALKSENSSALKIMFYFCSICSILDLKMFKDNSIWDEFIECYKYKVGDDFEDVFDKNAYDCVVARRENRVPYNFRVLKRLGQPVDHLVEQVIMELS